MSRDRSVDDRRSVRYRARQLFSPPDKATRRFRSPRDLEPLIDGLNARRNPGGRGLEFLGDFFVALACGDAGQQFIIGF